MRLDGRRESSNVEDRRGMSGGKKAGLGIGGIIIAMAIAYFTGGNPLEAGMQAAQQSMGQNTWTNLTQACGCSVARTRAATARLSVTSSTAAAMTCGLRMP